MGDRVSTTLTVLKEHEQQAVNLIDPEQGKPDDIDEGPETVLLSYYEVNYGTIEALTKFRAVGIAYTFSWDSGSEFDAGEESLRFTSDGQAQFNSQCKQWPYGVMQECLKIVTQASSLEDAQAALQAKVSSLTPLPWDNQAEYGRIYCATQLLQPNKE